MSKRDLFGHSAKIGLLADSHGSLSSIEKGAAMLKRSQSRTLIHLGDIFDSLDNDNLYDIYRLMIENGFLTVKGNNDYQVENQLKNGHTYDISQICKDELISFLQRMPLLLSDNNFCFTHSLPFNSVRSFYEPVDTGSTDRAELLFEETSYKLIFCGHSHSSILFRWSDGHVTREAIPQDKEIYFNDSERYIVIVGASDNGECGVFDKGRMAYQRVNMDK